MERILTREAARIFETSGVVFNALEPGVVPHKPSKTTLRLSSHPPTDMRIRSSFEVAESRKQEHCSCACCFIARMVVVELLPFACKRFEQPIKGIITERPIVLQDLVQVDFLL